MGISIQRVEGEELADIVRKIGGYAFRQTPPLPEFDETVALLKSRKNGRTLILFEDNLPLVCAGSSPMTQNIRGKIFDMAGVYGVAAWPKVRRKGYTYQLMIELLKQEQERGAAISALYPFRESFYERFGYTLFPLYWIYQFPVHTLRPTLELDLKGEVDALPMAEAYSTFYDYLHITQKNVHGFSLFDDLRMSETRENNKQWVAVARIENQVVGLMAYKITGYEEPIIINPFIYTTIEGRYLLLEWLARHIDQVSEVHVQLPSYNSPETWLSDIAQELKAKRPFRIPMGRIIDIEHINGLQAGTGKITLKIDDPQFAWNNDVFCFENDENGLLKVSRGGIPDCEITIQALSAWVYGTHDPVMYAMRGWGNPKSTVQAQMRALLPSASPYLYEDY